MGGIIERQRKIYPRNNQSTISTINQWNPTLEELYGYYNRDDGYINRGLFTSLLQMQNQPKIAQLLFNSFSSYKERMTFNDIQMLYSVFALTNKKNKIIFLSYFIFQGAEQLEISEYIENAKLLYNNSDNPLIKDEFTNSIVEKGVVIQSLFIEAVNKCNIIDKLNVKSVVETSTPCEFKPDINYVCDCLDKKRKQQEKEQDSAKMETIYGRMSYKFSSYQVDGRVPLEVLLSIFSKVEVTENFIQLIMGYMKKKTLKKYIEFLNFKDLLIKVRSAKTTADKINFLYEIASYPQYDSITKDNLKLLLKVDSSIEKMKIDYPNKLTKEDFQKYMDTEEIEQIKIKLLSNFDKINLVPYLVFEQTPVDPISIKLCLNHYLENLNFTDYINKHLKESTKFYCIDADFCNKLEEYFIKTDVEMPKIALEKISSLDNRKRLNDKLEYTKDFFVCNEIIYNFLKRTFGISDLRIDDIVLSKIEYNIKENESAIKEDNIYHFGSEMLMEQNKDNITEVEFYPIAYYSYSYRDIYYFLAQHDEETPETLIDKIYEQTNKCNFTSRKTTFKEVLDVFLKKYEKPIKSPSLYLFYKEFDEHKAKKIEDLSRTFEDEKIRKWCHFYIDYEIDDGRKRKTPITYYQKIYEKDIKEEFIEEEKKEEKPKEQEVKKEKKEKEKEKDNNKEKQEKKKEEEKMMVEEAQKEEEEDTTVYPLRLANIGNTCYLNSVMQILVNLPQLKEILNDNDKITKMINRISKFSHNGEFIDQFLRVINLRWEVNYAKKNNNVNLRPFKSICGKIQPRFDTFEQQDGNEFLTFVLDELHEELNIKYKREYIPNPDNEFHHNTEEELSNLYWANYIRRSSSFINALFSFQLKSILTCEECQHSKISYESTNNLYVPIPLSNLVSVTIIINRLPFAYKLYYPKVNSEFKEFNEKSKDNTIIKNLTSFFNEKALASKEEDLINPSIPMTITLTINKTITIQDLIDSIRSINYLELEPRKQNEDDVLFTDFITCSVSYRDNVSYFSESMKVDDCFQNNQKIYLFEVLNSNAIAYLNSNCKSIRDVFKIKETKEEITDTGSSNKQILPLSKYIETFLSRRGSPKVQELKDKAEFPITVENFIQKGRKFYLFESYSREKLDFNPDIIVVNNTDNNFIPVRLYDFIWEKYRRFLKEPNKSEDKLWWRNNTNTSKVCYPFKIKICKSDDYTYQCDKCEWWQFCSGCIVNPFSNDPIELKPKLIIVVEWCRLLIDEELLKESIQYKIDYDKDISKKETNNKMNNEPERTLDECMNLFFDKEKLEDELSCSFCNKRQHFYKNYQIDRVPPVLIITLKRFKYATMYNNKITTYITFPINDFAVNNEVFDLYGIVNHMGSLNSGHYTAYVKSDGKWMYFDDSRYTEVKDEKDIISRNAYILVYINKNQPKDKMYYSLMNDILEQIDPEKETQIVKPKKFYEGEPIYHENYGKCYYIKEMDNTFSSVKFNWGFGSVKTNSLQHEVYLDTTVKPEVEKVEPKTEVRNETVSTKETTTETSTRSKEENNSGISEVRTNEKSTRSRNEQNEQEPRRRKRMTDNCRHY